MCHTQNTTVICGDCGKKQSSTSDKICPNRCRRPLEEKDEIIKQTCAGCKPYSNRTDSRAVVVKSGGSRSQAPSRAYTVASSSTTQNGPRRHDTVTARPSAPVTLLAASRKPEAYDRVIIRAGNGGSKSESRHGESRHAPPNDYGRSNTVVKAESQHGESRNGESRHGESRHGESRHGESRHGESRHGESRHGTSVRGDGGSRAVTKADTRYGTSDNYSTIRGRDGQAMTKADSRHGTSDNYSTIRGRDGGSQAMTKVDARHGTTDNHGRSNAVAKADSRGISSLFDSIAARPKDSHAASYEYEVEKEVHIRIRQRVRVSKGSEQIVSRDPVSSLGDRFSNMGISSTRDSSYRTLESDRLGTSRTARPSDSSYGTARRTGDSSYRPGDSTCQTSATSELTSRAYSRLSSANPSGNMPPLRNVLRQYDLSNSQISDMYLKRSGGRIQLPREFSDDYPCSVLFSTSNGEFYVDLGSHNRDY